MMNGCGWEAVRRNKDEPSIWRRARGAQRRRRFHDLFLGRSSRIDAHYGNPRTTLGRCDRVGSIVAAVPVRSARSVAVSGLGGHNAAMAVLEANLTRFTSYLRHLCSRSSTHP